MSNMTTYEDVWQFVENAPKYVEATADLWHWSTNFDAGQGPISLFLDIIGWSDDTLGEPIYSLKDASLGYLEIDKLGKALREYADRPGDVRTWIDELTSYEDS